MKKRIVVTGIGIVSPLGIGKETFWNGLWSGKSGIKPISLFDTSWSESKLAGEITNFDVRESLGNKGIRTFDRLTGLTVTASKLALDDAFILRKESIKNKMGVVLGTMLGSIRSISEFDKELIIDGPRYVNPVNFPRTLSNSPASEVSIRYGIRGFNSTLSTGFSAGLDAIGYAIELLNSNKANAVLVGGTEELCIQTFLGFYKLGFLAGSKDNKKEISTPFDKRRNGIILGEGACMLVLEELQVAIERGAKIYAEVSGYATTFDAYKIDRYSIKGEGARRAMRMALDDNSLEPGYIDYICAAANSTVECDLMETKAIKDIFGYRAKKIPVSSIKSMLGECLGVSGAFQVVASIGALIYGKIPPTINLEESDPNCDLDYVPNKMREVNTNKVLINAFGPDGRNSSVIISKYEG